MVIQTDEIMPDQVAVVKVIYTENKKAEKKKVLPGQQQLEIQGFSNDGHVLFKYTNGDLEQTFGVNVKKYMAHQ